MVNANNNYRRIRRGERICLAKMAPEYMQMVLTVRDIRGCTVRGATELLIRTGWAALMRHGFLDKIPKDRWLGIVCEALGIDIVPLLKNTKIGLEKKS